MAGPRAVAAATATASPVGAATRTVTVQVVGGKVTPKPGRVSAGRGEKIKLVVTGDVADKVHVHGYDLTLPLKPGKPATLLLTADTTGLFDVETHETALPMFQLLVR